MKSEVYFVRVVGGTSEERVTALKELLGKVNPFPVYKKEEIIPVKITLGDSSCIYNLSPELVKVIIAEIKKQKSRPFLFDTSVIYKGQRQNAIDHLSLAQNKGFAYAEIGAPFIIADGIFGNDGKEYHLDSAKINRVKLPSFIGMLDSLLVLSHPTGHIVSGYAGAIKNVAMGMSSRATKQIQHSSLKPKVIEKNCTACGCCIALCPVGAIAYKNKKAWINPDLCIGCAECLCACKFDAIFINWQEDPRIFCERMVEVASFILSRFKNKFFINFAFDITKECDCISAKDEKMICASLGILASKDILSLDKATMDLAWGKRDSDFLERTKKVYTEMFDYASQRGLGSVDYKLVEF